MKIKELLKIFKDKTNEDIDRVDALKDVLLEIDNSPEKSTDVEQSIIKILIDTDDDYLVRQHAGSELSYYCGKKLDNKLIKLILNQSEDLDIRINTYSSLAENFGNEITQFLKNISSDDEMKNYL